MHELFDGLKEAPMAFEVLKQQQATAWEAGSTSWWPTTPPTSTRTCSTGSGLRSGERWLDLAIGTGAVAIRAARKGAVVTGQDFAEGLLDSARRRAAGAGVQVRFDLGDCERLPYADGSFDVVSSALGAVFAPDHLAVAHELTRVCRPDGRIGLAACRPDGALATFFGMLVDSQPPPEGAGKPLDWGRCEHVQRLLGDAFVLEFFDDRSLLLGDSPESLWELFVNAFGSIKALAESLDDERRRALHDAFVEYLSGYLLDDGSVCEPREYVVIVGRRLT